MRAFLVERDDLAAVQKTTKVHLPRTTTDLGDHFARYERYDS